MVYDRSEEDDLCRLFHVLHVRTHRLRYLIVGSVINQI